MSGGDWDVNVEESFSVLTTQMGNHVCSYSNNNGKKTKKQAILASCFGYSQFLLWPNLIFKFPLALLFLLAVKFIDSTLILR